MKEYTLVVKGKRVLVTYDVYKTYYQEYEHEKYLKSKSVKYEHSLEQCIETDVFIRFIYLHGLTTVGDGIFKPEQLSHLPYC